MRVPNLEELMAITARVEARPLLTVREQRMVNDSGFSTACFLFGVWWSLYTRNWRAFRLQLAGYLGVAFSAFVFGVLTELGLPDGYLEVGKTLTLAAWAVSTYYIAWNARAWRAASLKREFGLPD